MSTFSVRTFLSQRGNSLPFRWMLQLCLLVLLILTNSQLLIAAPLPQTQVTATVVASNLNVRAGPGTSYNRIAGVKRNDRLTVIGQSGNCAWLKVTTPQNSEGWVSGGAKYVKLNGACSAITSGGAQSSSNQSATTGSTTTTNTAANTTPPPAGVSADLSGLTGKLLYTVANQDAKRWELWEFTFANQSTNKIADWRTELDVSSDGRQIAYFAWPGEVKDQAGVWIMDGDYSHNRLLILGGAYPSFNPGGDRLALNGGEDIYIVTSDGNDVRLLTRGEYPAWSPVDNNVAHRGCVGGSCGIWLIDANSKDPNAKQQLTTGGGDGQPAWSPDGKRIAYISKEDGNFEVYVINADGTGKQRLTNDLASDGLPRWSPDGQWIAFRSDRGGQWAIYAMRADGSDLRKIVDASVLAEWFFEKMIWR